MTRPSGTCSAARVGGRERPQPHDDRRDEREQRRGEEPPVGVEVENEVLGLVEQLPRERHGPRVTPPPCGRRVRGPTAGGCAPAVRSLKAPLARCARERGSRPRPPGPEPFRARGHGRPVGEAVRRLTHGGTGRPVPRRRRVGPPFPVAAGRPATTAGFTEDRARMPTYRIDVYTGQARPGEAAATDANVFVTLYGSRASSAELPVGHGGNGNGRFGLTGVDTVTVHLPDLGEVTPGPRAPRQHRRGARLVPRPPGGAGRGPGRRVDVPLPALARPSRGRRRDRAGPRRRRSTGRAHRPAAARRWRAGAPSPCHGHP